MLVHSFPMISQKSILQMVKAAVSGAEGLRGGFSSAIVLLLLHFLTNSLRDIHKPWLFLSHLFLYFNVSR